MGKTSAARRDEGGEAQGGCPIEAAVLRVEDGRAVVRLLDGTGASGEQSARVALPGFSPAEGDRVLVQRAAGSGTLYLVGVVHAAAPEPSIAAPGGARATVRGDTLVLQDAAGALVASYDARTGELRVAAPGDLRLAAPEGRVLIEGKGGVRIAGGTGEQPSALELREGAVSLDASSAAFAVGHWELRAERVVERLTDVYRNVDGLLETRAKRLRTLVATTLELFGRRTTITSEKDTRIDGERVLLG